MSTVKYLTGSGQDKIFLVLKKKSEDL